MQADKNETVLIDKKYLIRHATLEDVPAISSHRRRMFAEIDGENPEMVDARDEVSLRWLREHIEAGTYIGFLMDHAGQVIGGAGLYLIDWPPDPFSVLIMRRPFVYNVYVEPEFRSKGIARRLMEAIIAYCKAEGYDAVSLHTSEAGRPLYESMGFQITTEMGLSLNP